MASLRPNLKIKVGTYTGTGAALEVSSVGFPPDVVIVKGGANIACFRTRQMRGDSTAFFAGNTANFAGGILGLTATGFFVGTDAKANANGTTYYYVALWGAAAQAYFRIFTYMGNNTDGRQLTAAQIAFTPDLAFIKGDTAQNPVVRSLAVVGDNSWHFSGTADTTNEIQAFVTNGLDLGNSSRVNGNLIEYFGVAMKELAGVIKTFTYTGDAADNRSIIGLGFQPDFVLIKNGTTTNSAALRTSDFVGDSSTSVGSAGPGADVIQSFISDGFTIGTNVSANGSTNTFWGFALKAGEYNVPIARTAL